MKIIECVPNFSEGKSKEIIDSITNEISSIKNISLLDVDMGSDTNRTVVTFAGEPEDVIDAAFLSIKRASELINMKNHVGEHPRMGATDVCPLIPVSNVTMQECVKYSNILAKRVASELDIQVYMYEESAKIKERRNLATVRSGEYEAMAEKTQRPDWRPDYGPSDFNEQSGVTAIGARNYLIAYNVNLNTKEKKIATDIALDIREAGRAKRDYMGKILRKKDGTMIKKPGTLKHVKAVGWYIDEYDKAQVSINIINYIETPLHIVFEEVRNQARKRGLRVTGSEIVGLVPKRSLFEAGLYYIKSQNLSTAIPQGDIIDIAIDSLGLNEISKFSQETNIIENRLLTDNSKSLVKMNLDEFADELSINSPAPGGGSASAYAGALASSLVSMVTNLSYGNKKYLSKNDVYEEIGVKAQEYKDKLLRLVDSDTDAFNDIMTAFRLPRKTDNEIKYREKAIETATKFAIDIPFEVMKTSLDCLKLSKKIAKIGNINSLSDAGVASELSYASIKGAYLNVLINLMTIGDKKYEKIKRRQTKVIIVKSESEIIVARKYLNSKLK